MQKVFYCEILKCYVHAKTKMLADFQICICVPLKFIEPLTDTIFLR